MEEKQKIRFINDYLDGNDVERIQMMSGAITALYRYRSITGEKLMRELDALQQEYIWLQSLNALNDAKEGMLMGASQDTRNKLRSFRKKYGNSSFSECVPYEKGSDHMWLNYADENKGMCLEYRVEDMARSRYLIAPVAYWKCRRESELIERYQGKVEAIYLEKDKDWSAEREWRHLDKISGEGQRCKENILPHKIYVKKDMADSDRDKISQVALEKGIALEILE